jgi:hypothetical protein
VSPEMDAAPSCRPPHDAATPSELPQGTR